MAFALAAEKGTGATWQAAVPPWWKEDNHEPQPGNAFDVEGDGRVVDTYGRRF